MVFVGGKRVTHTNHILGSYDRAVYVFPRASDSPHRRRGIPSGGSKDEPSEADRHVEAPQISRRARFLCSVCRRL